MHSMSMARTTTNSGKFNSTYTVRKSLRRSKMSGDRIVLTYFNERGRAELPRLIMTYGGIPFEDKRIDEEKDWPRLKQELLTRQLPMLEVNGLQLFQSMAISEYLARRAGLCGSDHLEAAVASMIVHCITDMIDYFVNFTYFEPDEKTKERKELEFKTKTVPDGLKTLEKFLERNGGEWFVGNQLTWADIAVADFCHPDALSYRLPGVDMKATVPKLFEHAEKVSNLSKISEWFEKRPKTFA